MVIDINSNNRPFADDTCLFTASDNPALVQICALFRLQSLNTSPLFRRPDFRPLFPLLGHLLDPSLTESFHLLFHVGHKILSLQTIRLLRQFHVEGSALLFGINVRHVYINCLILNQHYAEIKVIITNAK